MQYEDLEFTQLREEYEESLTNPYYQQTNSSSNTYLQLTVVPVPTRSESQLPTRSQSHTTVQSQISNAPSTQLTQYRKTTPSSNESHRFSNPPSAIQDDTEPNYTPSITKPLPQQNNSTRDTSSTDDISHPIRNTPFIPITREKLGRRRHTPSITQPLRQHNQRLHNERQP